MIPRYHNFKNYFLLYNKTSTYSAYTNTYVEVLFYYSAIATYRLIPK